MRKLHIWMLCGLVIALLLWLLAESLAVNLQAGRSVPLFSVYRYDPLGMAAFDQYLRRSGVDVKLLKYPAFNSQWHGVFIDINPPGNFDRLLESATLTHHYHPRLMRWVRNGNTLFEVTYEPTRLTDHEQLAVKLARSKPTIKKVHPAGKHPSKPVERTSAHLTTHPRVPPATHPAKRPTTRPTTHPLPAKTKKVGAASHPHRLRFVIREAGWVKEDLFYFKHRNPRWYNSTLIPAHWQHASQPGLSSPAGNKTDSTVWLAMPSQFIPKNKRIKKLWHPLLTWHGRMLAAERSFGKGRVVILGSPWPLLNGGIAQGNNLDFLMSIIGRRSVIFNEYGLGIGGQMTTLELFSKFGLDALGCQLLIILVAILWAARRFSRPRAPLDRTVVASNIEQIAMLGRLYQQTMSPTDMNAGVAAEIRRRIAASLKVKPADTANALGRLNAGLRDRVTHLLSRADALAGAPETSSWRRNAALPTPAQLLSQSVVLCEEIKRDRKS
ncbi:MAG: hypothetical protein ACP5O1_00640 [Phycisphaerae bacterium]